MGRHGESFARHAKVVIRGSGANVFDTADSFHFVRRPLAGDFALTAKLDSFEAASEVAKAGLMLRASTAADSAHAMVHWLPQGQVEFIWRAADGAAAGYVWAAATTPWPPRLRLQRAGQLVTAFYSTDGAAWLQVGAPQVINLPATVLGGPAVCAHDTGDTGVATFSNISTSGDRDGDGVLDPYETLTGVFVSGTDTGTDPDNPDTDGDGFSDGAEVANGTNPLVPNTEMVWQSGAAPGGSGAWDASTPNWRIGSAPSSWIPGKTALFGGTAGTVTVGGGATGVAGMIFNSANYVLDGTGPISFQQEATLANASTGNTIITTPLAGSSTLALTGGGTLHLRGDNRGFSGSLVVDGNTQLRPYNSATSAASGHETGDGETTVEVRAGSQIRWYNLTGNAAYTSGFRIAGIGLVGGNPGALNLDTAITRTITLNGGVEAVGYAMIGTQNSGSFALNGPVTGSGDLTFNQQGAASSTINGPLTVNTLNKTGFATLTLTTTTLSSSNLIVTDGTLDFNPSADTTFSGTLAKTLTGQGSVTKSGPNTLTLAGANTFGTSVGTFTFGGGTTNVGALRLAHPQALGYHQKILLNSGQGGVSRLELAGGHTFQLEIDTAGRNTAAGQVALRNHSGANRLQGRINIAATGGAYYLEALAGSSLTINSDIITTLNAQTARDVRFVGDGDIMLQGSLRDSTSATPTRLAVTKEGNGTLTLTGTSTHQLPTSVKAGTLALDGTFTASAVTVDAGATLTGSGALPAATIRGKLSVDLAGDPLDFTGALALDNATLHITGATIYPVEILATHTSLTGTFAAVTGVPVGYTLDTQHNGNAIALVRKPTAEYEIWAVAHGLDPATTGASAADADADGSSNQIEFALGTLPNNAGSRTTPEPYLVSAGNNKYLCITVLARFGAFFSGDPPSATQDGVVYVIEGGPDPSSPGGGVMETVPPTGLPSPPPGYQYRSFALRSPVSSAARGFLRVRVESANP